MRISDWSSDVCSSDLSSSNHPLAQAIVCHTKAAGILTPAASDAFATAGKAAHATVVGRPLAIGSPVYAAQAAALSPEQQDRKSVGEGKSVSVRVELGCGRIIKKKKKQTNTNSR